MNDFEMNFKGISSDGKDFGCSMRISGDLETIGKLFADYAIAEVGIGHPEPMRILIAAFNKIQERNEGSGKIIMPNFKKN